MKNEFSGKPTKWKIFFSQNEIIVRCSWTSIFQGIDFQQFKLNKNRIKEYP